MAAADFGHSSRNYSSQRRHWLSVDVDPLQVASLGKGKQQQKQRPIECCPWREGRMCASGGGDVEEKHEDDEKDMHLFVSAASILNAKMGRGVADGGTR